MRPAQSEYPEGFEPYVSKVPETEVLPALEAQIALIDHLPARVGNGRETYAYGPGKWTVRQVLGHVNDGERVFAYRALAFSRFDANALPSFDENAYVAHGRFDDAPLRGLADEFVALRRANLQMLRRFDEAQWKAAGTANNRSVTVRALAYVMAGHVRHHLGILAERYGI